MRTHSKRLRVSIELGGRTADRQLAAPRCETLAVTAAWLIAVAVDPALPEPAPADEQAQDALGSLPAESASSMPEQPAAAPQTRSSKDLAEAARTRATLWGRIGILAGLWGASLPGPVAGLGARAGLGVGWFYLELRGAHLFADSRPVSVGVVRIDSQELVLSGCAQIGARLRGGSCLTLAGMRTHANIEGTTEPGADSVFWALAGLSGHLAWLFRAPFELHTEAGLQLPISPRPRFQVRGVGEVERASIVAGYWQLGLTVRIE